MTHPSTTQGTPMPETCRFCAEPVHLGLCAPRPATDTMCNCEHTNHFTDEFGPQVGHDYMSVPAGEHSDPWVGPVCDTCHNTCHTPLRDDNPHREWHGDDCDCNGSY